VQARTAEILAERSAAVPVDVLRELAAIAFADAGDLFQAPDPADPAALRLVHPRRLPLHVRKAIASIKVRREKIKTEKNGETATRTTVEVLEYRLWSKPDALEKIGRHLGIFQPLPPIGVLLAHVAAEHGQAAADLLKEALASAAAKARERQVSGVDSANACGPANQAGEVHDSNFVEANNQTVNTPQGTQGGQGQAPAPYQESGHIRPLPHGGGSELSHDEQFAGNRSARGSDAYPPSTREEVVPGDDLPSVPGLHHRGAAPATPGPQPTTTEIDLPEIRRPTREEDVRGGRCKPGRVPHHGISVDLD
jgi:hypothetical protein